MSEFELTVADADQYRITLAGVPLSRGAGQGGYADGEFLTATQEEWFDMVEGSDGSIARSKLNGVRGDIVLHLLQTSPSNDYLSSLLALDLNDPDGQGIGSFCVEDMQGTTLILCTRTWIVKPTDFTLDRMDTPVAWHLQGLWSVWAVGGDNDRAA